MSEHEISIFKKHLEIELQKLREERKEDTKMIMSILTPISDTYKTASRLGKWTMGFLIFLSVFVGLIVGVKNLWSNK